ncbi:MAG: hypothetical protein E6J78_20175 [Deltaproteobacteria bacterium]|nr:MAG: hypothetical protein E6J78_20175 [Deltaproteobacteria bacterium]
MAMTGSEATQRYATMVLRLVRNGYAVANPSQLDPLRDCPDLDIVDEKWVPRWALEAEAAFQESCYTRAQQRAVFSRGQAAVLEELSALVHEGKRPYVFKSRDPWQRHRIDASTETAIRAALQQHRQSCLLCQREQSCAEAAGLQQEMQQLFPRDRRKSKRA